MKRREFIILSSVGATSASLLSACGHPEEKLIPALIPDDQYVPGIDYWKASTCGMCAAGCGIIVRTREHKANKIEGNPLHPVNRGALCARGQAGLEVLYNPDRIKGPLKRAGERGEGKWQEIAWDEAIKTLAEKLREVDPNDADEKALFFTSDAESITAYVAGHLMQSLGQVFIAKQPSSDVELPGVYADLLRDVVKLGEPIADIANASYLLSFGARFLETWKSPVMYSLAYGEFRSGRGKMRGRFVHVEPRMSLTAANADEWIPAAPGAEALFALAMVQVIVREGSNKSPVSDDAQRMLQEFSPENTASMIDVAAERIIRVAREFAKAERPLAIGDLRFPAAAAVHLLNAIVDNLNKPGGVLLLESESSSKNPLKAPGNGLVLGGDSDERVKKPPSDSVELISRFFRTMPQRFRMIMSHGFNPMLAGSGREELLATPFIVSFSSFMDETSEAADLVLPDHSYLERWDTQISYGPDGRKVLSLTQPVIEPQLNTRETADVLLSVAREIGGKAGEALPFDSAKEVIEKAAGDLVKHVGGAMVETAWSELTMNGLISAAAPAPVKAQPGEQPMSLSSFFLEQLRRDVSGAATNATYPLILIAYERSTLGGGLGANLPSIQELPDTMTSVIWGSWVEINPKTAAMMGIADGDLVEVTTITGSVRAPALLYPGIRPDCIAVPAGPSSYGRYARGRTIDPATLLQPDGQSTVRSSLTRVGGKAQLIRFSTEVMEHMESKR